MREVAIVPWALCLDAPLVRHNSTEREPGCIAVPGCLNMTADVAVHTGSREATREDMAKVES